MLTYCYVGNLFSFCLCVERSRLDVIKVLSTLLFGICDNGSNHLFVLCLQDTFSRYRRQTVDSTSSTVNKIQENKHNNNGESDTARDGDKEHNTTLIYFITPTYPRREQIAELTRLGQTLMHVSRLYWIVADDRPDCSPQIMNLLPDFSENNVQ